MASIARQADGRARILFIEPDGKRRTIYLDAKLARDAESTRRHIENILSARATDDAPAVRTAQWLADLPEAQPKLHAKLVKVGLAQPHRQRALGGFIDTYIERRSDVKPTTRLVYHRVRGYLVDYFGADKPLREITPGDADAWRLWLIEKGLADNTIRRSCGIAKQYATAAVRQRLIPSNPFGDLVAAIKANPKRYYFVTREESQRVLDACPDAEWRLLFALARYGGLRVPSEALRLRWADIDWEGERFTVPSPKTEHHEGHESRVVPLFPELAGFLRDAFELAADGAEFCIMRYRDTAMNLRTKLQRIIRQAGLEGWPKLWQNLRSTRETELCDIFPAHVASAWIGNSVPVAMKHYLQVTEDHFAEASQKTAQKTAHQSPTTGHNGQQAEIDAENGSAVSADDCGELTADAVGCGSSIDVTTGRYWT